ncbi:ScyD/ScyE family protein [Agrococcus sp. HG114]|uniref:ScyD/ScyE family protein n=1 Tax=Agrococcus sp. HG114 TaxID=2969757 RepID=UPI00215ADFE3|nr:ScyD/ScyE family protein [Agrococcus sp. HG114]MCR8671831.1 ScyD/ScyE family protein [Agrococcus sp. HG114]
MPRRIRSTTTAAALSALLGIALLSAGVVPAGAAPPSDETVTVATGLNNPRQLSVGPGQALYIAEAGVATDCTPIPGAPPEFQVCGLTGSVTEVSRDGQRRVVTGLPTMDFGGEVIGASDVAVRGNRIAVLTGGLAAASTARDSLPEQYAAFGTLRTGDLRAAPLTGADLTLEADALAYEVEVNPDGNQPPDSNAVGFTSLGGDRWAIVDAGGNTLLRMGDGAESTIAVLPNGEPVPNPFGPGMIPPQAVPTDVAIGPDGAYYVSQLTGFPFPTGGSSIWRITADGEASVYATGLTMVTSLAWRGDTLYAVQLDDANFFDGHIGSLREVIPGGSEHEAVVDGLSAPYGVAIHGHWAYVTVDSVSSGDGSVIRVDLR